MSFLHYFVRLAHLFLILFIIMVPLCPSSVYLLTLHSMFLPLMCLHWYLHNDVCALTEIEKVLTNRKNNKDTFIGSILGPVYEPKSDNVLKITLVLWSITLYKLNSHFNLIQ
jgi:hypothetical protein